MSPLYPAIALVVFIAVNAVVLGYSFRSGSIGHTAATDVSKASAASGESTASVGMAFLSHRFPKLASIPAVPPVPADNPGTPAKVELGRLLFFDNRLSGDSSTSCATCHLSDMGWGDGNAISRGYPGTWHWRNSQTVVNSAYLKKLFWAGESLSLEAQAKSAATGNLAGNVDPAMAEERMAQIPKYVHLFRAAFGVHRPTFSLAMRAIAAFERAETNSIDSPFDQYMRGEGALSESAVRGMVVFQGRAGCVQCHNGPLLTDEGYHNVGVPKNSRFEEDPLSQIALRYQHYSRGVSEAVYRSADGDLGLYYTTKRDVDKGKFRTAPLRYLKYTAPYMHNGVFMTLKDVVEFYDLGGGSDTSKSELLRPLDLTDQDKADLLAFLDSLSGPAIIIERPDLPPYVAFAIATERNTP